MIFAPLPLPESLAALLPAAPDSVWPENPSQSILGTSMGIWQSASADAFVTARLLRQSGEQIGTVPSTWQGASAIFFDLDSTVIAEETIVELARAVGKAEEVERITERAMAGKIDFAAALHERLGLLRGLNTAALPQIARQLTLRSGMRELAAAARSRNVPMILLSGGFRILAEEVVAGLGFYRIFAHALQMRDGMLTGGIDGPLIDRAKKGEYVLEVCRELQLDPKTTAAVGDGANDLDMFAAVGLRLGFQAKHILWDKVDFLNVVGDHRLHIPLLWPTKLSNK